MNVENIKFKTHYSVFKFEDLFLTGEKFMIHYREFLNENLI